MIIILLYSIQKIDVMISKKDVNILTAINDAYLDSDFSFSFKQGYNIAVKW